MVRHEEDISATHLRAHGGGQTGFSCKEEALLEAVRAIEAAHQANDEWEEAEDEIHF